jgi:hypothetical protein
MSVPPNQGRSGASGGRLLTADDLAARPQVNTGFVYALSRRGEIPTVRLGRYHRYRLDAIERWEEEQSGTVGADRKPTARPSLRGLIKGPEEAGR